MASVEVAINGERQTNEKTVAEHCLSAGGSYVAALARGLTKVELIEQVSLALEGVDPEDIISVTYHADWLWFFPLWRRNSALILIRPGASAG